MHRPTAIRLLTLIFATFALVFALESATSAPVRANALDTASDAHLVIEGKAYSVAWGHDIELPTTLLDGSKGWIHFRANKTVAQSDQHVGLVASYIFCPTISGHETWVDKYGITLATYTLYQYWCNDGTYITSYAPAYKESASYLGWSLANHTEGSNYYPPYEVVGTGTFRFNGPFGQCESGSIVIYGYGDGTDGKFVYNGGYYGC